MDAQNSNSSKNIKPIAGTIYFKKFLDFDAQLLRAFSYDKDYGPSYGLCISTAMKITEGDFEGWYTEWKSSGDRLFSSAQDSGSKGHFESARRNYLAASVCYRSADFFIRQNLDDKRIIPLADMQRNSFRKGFEGSDFGMKVINIPYENTTLDGYLFTADKSGKPKPMLIYMVGYDSFAEESFYGGIYQALIRGYNVITYDGPGQGQVLRRQKLYFRPDWENVSSKVVDFAEALPETDKNKIVLWGRSFAGYLAPRAACFDSRPAALIADAALFDLGEAIKKLMPFDQFQLLIEKKDEELNKIFEKMFEDKEKAYYYQSRMSCHGAKTVPQYLRMLMEYSVNGISQNIKIPAFISSGEYDFASVAQSKQLYDTIGSKDKTNIVFKGSDGAGEHCEFANQDIINVAMFDWLDERMK